MMRKPKATVDQKNSAIKGTQLLQRTFQIVELIARYPKGLGLSEISQKTNIPLSTVHRILSFLNSYDYIRNDKETGLYFIGPKFALFSSIFVQSFDFLKEIRPALETINKEFDETVHLGILNSKRTGVVYIDKIESSRLVRMFSIVGQTVPIHCTALGKSLIAALPDHEIEAILEAYTFNIYTGKTISTRHKFLEEIDRVRRLGYAVDYKEHEKNIICYAKSLLNPINKNFAAISISIPEYRFDEKDVEKIIKSLNNAVNWFESKLAISHS